MALTNDSDTTTSQTIMPQQTNSLKDLAIVTAVLIAAISCRSYLLSTASLTNEVSAKPASLKSDVDVKLSQPL